MFARISQISPFPLEEKSSQLSFLHISAGARFDLSSLQFFIQLASHFKTPFLAPLDLLESTLERLLRILSHDSAEIFASRVSKRAQMSRAWRTNIFDFEIES